METDTSQELGISMTCTFHCLVGKTQPDSEITVSSENHNCSVFRVYGRLTKGKEEWWWINAFIAAGEPEILL